MSSLEEILLSFFEEAEIIRQLSSNIFDGDIDSYAIIPAASYRLSAATRAIEPPLNKGEYIVLS